MSYQRLSTPRFYMDNANWQYSKGLSRNSSISVKGGTLNAGSDKYQLLDMNPLNAASFDFDTTSKVSIRIDMGLSGLSNNFVAILGHNFASSGITIRVAHSNSDIAVAGGTTAVALTEVLNGTVSGSYPNTIATPSASGDTILTFTANTSRYWLIEFNDALVVGGDYDIGQIVVGKYYTMPVSPDMPVTKGTTYEGVTVRKSVGGKAFGSASWTAPNTGDYTPFRGLTEETKMGGRETFDFSVGFVDDDDIYPEDRAAITASANILSDVVNKTSMNLIPFIFAASSTSTTSGDYLYARFDQNSFESVRKAWKVDSFVMRVVQEF